MQKSRLKSLLIAGALSSLLLGSMLAKAQEEQANKPGAKELMAAAEKLSKPPVSVYRLDYKVYEVEGGKRTNSRSYTVFVRTLHYSAHLRTGNRVPINVGTSGGYQYQDVGMNIDSSIDEQEGKLLVSTVLDMKSIAPSEPGSANPTGNPVFRNLRLDDVTLAVAGKPTLVGSIDDVTSNRRYEIEVTATKID